jgi:hypothetical protein
MLDWLKLPNPSPGRLTSFTMEGLQDLCSFLVTGEERFTLANNSSSMDRVVRPDIQQAIHPADLLEVVDRLIFREFPHGRYSWENR